MSKKTKNISSDLQGISQLTTDAVKGVTKVVESLHSTISHLTPILGKPKQKTKGITAVVYKSINTITEVIGKGIDTALEKTKHIEDHFSNDHRVSPAREAMVSAMNGVLGDHLEHHNNPLAIVMNFRRNGQQLNLQQLSALITQSTGTVTLMIHGLCMNDLQWYRDDHHHGQKIAEDLDHTIIYLHYNSGVHISENGRQLSHLLHAIESISNDSLSLNVVAHSMGGLVIRSACYYAEQLEHQWLRHLTHVIFLGTPHHGALLAKGGHWVDIMLQISPYSTPFASITSVRSNGITDLRHGYITDQDWDNKTRKDTVKSIVPLPSGVNCYAIATGRIDRDTSQLNGDIVSDGLVTINSALGKHKHMDLGIPDAHQWTGANINHMQLLSDHRVYAVIKHWLAD